MEQQPLDRGGEPEKNRGQRFIFGPWIFNVNRGLALVAEKGRDPAALPVVPWAHFYGLDPTDDGIPLFGPRDLDRDYAMTTDLDRPLLVATLRSSEGEQFPLLIDGTHRLYRAYQDGLDELPAYVLDVDESLAIREDGFIGSRVSWPSHDERRLPGSTTEPGDGRN